MRLKRLKYVMGGNAAHCPAKFLVQSYPSISPMHTGKLPKLAFFSSSPPPPRSEKMDEHQKQTEDFGKNDDFWLFGYGYVSHHSLIAMHARSSERIRANKECFVRSLIWKPPPHYGTHTPLSQNAG
jgi:hypothetical protein